MSADIQAGSSIYHKPTKEEWFVLGLDPSRDLLCMGGYPPTIAAVSDCVLVAIPIRELTAEEITYRKTTFGSEWE